MVGGNATAFCARSRRGDDTVVYWPTERIGAVAISYAIAYSQPSGDYSAMGLAQNALPLRDEWAYQ